MEWEKGTEIMEKAKLKESKRSGKPKEKELGSEQYPKQSMYQHFWHIWYTTFSFAMRHSTSYSGNVLFPSPMSAVTHQHSSSRM
jgi:hypothetical protein